MKNTLIACIFSILSFFLSVPSVHGTDGGVDMEGVYEQVSAMQAQTALLEDIQKDAYAFTKKLCYIFKFRHEYGNEEFPATVLAHPMRVIQKFPQDEELRESIKLWSFLAWEDFSSIVSEDAQIEYAVLFRSAMSKFLPLTKGFMEASRECGKEAGNPHLTHEIAAHIHTNSMLASIANFSFIFKLIGMTFNGVRRLPMIKNFLAKMNPKKKKILKWGVLGGSGALMGWVGYTVFIEVKKQKEAMEKAVDIFSGESSIIDKDAVSQSNKIWLKSMLRKLHRQYVFVSGLSSEDEDYNHVKGKCPEVNQSYHESFSRYANKEEFLSIVEEMGSFNVEEEIMEGIYEKVKMGAELTEEELYIIETQNLKYALFLSIDAEETKNQDQVVIKEEILNCPS